VLLVLPHDERLQVAAAQLPHGEQAAPLLQAITPWLDDARHTRLASLRHGPPGAAAVDQRSCLVAPLIAQHQILGYLYCDIEGAFGRFHDADRDLLAMLAAQAAVALANLRSNESLEHKVAERTAELAQRASELAVINSIQQGMAAELQFQAIVDGVGDRLRDVLRTQDMGIRWLDREQRCVHYLYEFEHGVRLQIPPEHIPEARWASLDARRAPVLRHTAAEIAAIEHVPGADASLSSAEVPIVGGDRLLGSIIVDSFEREHAFSDSDVRLLQTVAASLGVALENARLFDETQRLLKETEQRNAELAVINSIQQGMAAALNFQAIIDLVGDQLREVLKTDNIGIRWFEPGKGLIHFLYEYEHGQRLQLAPVPRIAGGPGDMMARTRRPVVLNNAAQMAAAGIQNVPGTDASKSALFVPILGDQLLGAIVLEDHERENAFGEAEVRLLGTIAASMGVALENARLFDETQRLLKEAERRSSELALLNSIQNGIAAQLDFQAIVDVVGDKLRELFGSDDIGITLIDDKSELIHTLYLVERGQRVQVAPFARNAGGMLEQKLMARQAVVLKDAATTAAHGIRSAPDTLPSRSSVFVPVMLGNQLRGAIRLVSLEHEDAFDEATVHLLSTVAASMGVALGNARLFDETQQALSQQRASADILRVISESPTDVQPVFDAVVGTAVKLLGCDLAVVLRCDDTCFSPVAAATPDGPLADMGPSRLPVDPSANFPSRAIVGKTHVHLPDWCAVDLPAHERRMQELFGVNASLMLPLLHDGNCIGVLAFARQRAGAFTDKEIALAESFRDQASIAIQNTRLFNETQEALEHQQASAEVLGVISASVAHTGPVFDKILECCHRLFNASSYSLLLVDGNGQLDMTRWVLTDASRATLGDARAAELERLLRSNYPMPLAGTSAEPAFRSGDLVEFADVLADAQAPLVLRRNAEHLQSTFANLAAPLMWEGRGIGLLSMQRGEPGPFRPAERTLLKTFADQAVIAIQNARLFNETQEALERQTASAEVLQVISNSVSDTRPVFDKILHSCQRLFACSRVSITLVDEHDMVQLTADLGSNAEVSAFTKRFYPLPLKTSLQGRAIRKRQVLHYPDVLHGDHVPEGLRGIARTLGNFSALYAPLLWEGRGIGAIVINRAPQPYSDKDIALLKTFADQAVIAIQNARLFNDTKEALERQKASAEVLSVIGTSRRTRFHARPAR
jgi:GAF domain-containing protein